MTAVVEVLRLLPPAVVLVVAVVLVAGETGVIVGLLFPVEITLVTVGFLAYVGDVPFLPALLLMFAAAMTGDALALRSGRKYGPRVRGSRLGRRVGEHRWARADQMLHRLGGRSAFVARWVPFVRTLLPRLAGSAGMPYRRYVPWNVAGVISAVGLPVVAGYLAGASYVRVAEALGRASTAVLMLLLAIVAIVLIGRWLGRHPHPVQALLARIARLPPLRAVVRRLGGRAGWPAGRTGATWALALNLAAGTAVLFGLGYGLTVTVRYLVSRSGLSAVDAAGERWLREQRTDPVAVAAEAVTTVLSPLVVVTAVMAVTVLPLWWRRGPAGDPVPDRFGLAGLAGSVGAVVPLVLLAVAAGLAGGDLAYGAPVAAGAFSVQGVVVTAGLCTLAWVLTRRARWPVAVAGWTAAITAIVLLLGARLYLGWDAISGAVTVAVLGFLWSVVFMAAWVVRNRRESASAGSPADPPAGGAPGSGPAGAAAAAPTPVTAQD